MNRSPWPFRLQIVLLWVGHLARVLGENCVRFIVLTAPLIELYRRESTPHREGGPDLLTVSYQPVWVVVASALPALALLPVLGRFARREVARTSLVASTLLALAVVAACLFTGSYTLIALAAISATSAVYAASRSVLLPELARGAAVPLVRLRASLAAFAALGVVGGVWLGAAYAAFDPFAEFAQTEYARSARAEPAGTLSPAAGVAFAAFAVAFLALLPLRLLPRGPEEPWADNISVPEGMTARWAWILRHRDAAAPLTALVVGGVVLLGAVYLV
ncbi:MAG TPA: hypothetical protein VIL46_08305, partial [Gemmataceae bacterium]